MKKATETTEAPPPGARLAPSRSSPRGSSARLYERAVDVLSQQIRSGALAPGEKLQETAIASRFGVSRAPVRRALQELEALRLVRKSDGYGYTVREGQISARGAAKDDAARRQSGEPQAAAEDPKALFANRASWEPIYDEVASEVTARMAFGSWRFNEVKLAEHYGVSRTVARDVAARLQQRGVLVKDDSSRWRAPGLTATRVAELYQLRALLEPVALLSAAETAPRGLLTRMRDNLVAALGQEDGVEGDVLDALEQELHVEFLAHCRNETLMQAITLHQSLLIAHRFLYRWTPKLFRREPLLPQHLEVVDPVLAGKPALAAERLEAHLLDSRERALSRIEVINAEHRLDDLPYLKPAPK